ncbi:hypothetical protein [Pseudanabaena sp. ABRG5-3]|uniref:hypothetical protein n=1 Tax=Pseudanabaena sp. ABRG5-3 TaxID=685565 RepID=UPI000DC71E2E|nr:hypothetical protein [Pseudanabaena sp. ABRG5-3]BBC23903.1 peptidoglycan binding domain protein [Pseudanabaena sp. ABRG5-3]
MNWLKRFIILGTTAIASLAIAQSASARFVIFVAGNDPETLQKVRTVSPTAFTTKINDQPVIQAGTFNSETSANNLANALANSGLTPQKYFSTSGGKESNVQVPFTDTTTSVAPLSNPQQVIIQQTPAPQTITDAQPQVFSSVPQQTIAYNNQYQQITTNAVVPQVQTQQVLVPRWQQVLVPETRQIVTQTVVPQTQLVQTGYTQSSYVQPTTSYVQPTNTTSYIQPQTGFVPSSTTLTPVNSTTTALAPVNSYNSYVVPSSSTNFSTLQTTQPVTTELSADQLLPQQTTNPNFRYVAAVPAKATNQFLLSQVRQYVPNAFFTNSGRGTYIHAGAYQNRDSAESVSRYLRSQGIDSRVLYF